MNEFKKTQQTSNEIKIQINDIIASDPQEAASALMLIIVEIYSKLYPANLSSEEVSLVKSNSPSVTDELIPQRAMSRKGVEFVLSTASTLSQIAIDYSPLSNVKAEIERDSAAGDGVMTDFSTSVIETYFKGIKAGMTDFGVSATMTHTAIDLAKYNGVDGIKLSRILLDVLGRSFMPNKKITNDKTAEERAISALCNQMGISRTTALKYIDSFKAMKDKDIY